MFNGVYPSNIDEAKRPSPRRDGRCYVKDGIMGTDADMFKRESSACRHRGGVAVAARSLLAELRTPGNKETLERVKAKFPEENQACVSEAAVGASSFDQEEGSGPNWRPEEKFDPQVALEVINSRNALSGAASDGLRFSRMQSTIRTGFGREKSKLALKPSGEELSMTQKPSLLNSGSSSCDLTALGKKCCPVCIGMTWRRLISAGTMRQWRPRLEEANREARTFGVGVRGGVELVALRARVHHDTKNRLILTDYSNAFNTVKRTAMLAEVATCVSALTPWQNVTARCLRLCSFRWNREKGGRSSGPTGYSKGMPWGRRCSACRSWRC